MPKRKPRKGSKKGLGSPARKVNRKATRKKPVETHVKKTTRKPRATNGASSLVPKRVAATRSEAAQKGWKTRRKNLRKKQRAIEKGKRTRALRRAGIKKPKERKTKLFKYTYRDYGFRTVPPVKTIKKLIDAETEGGHQKRLMQGTVAGKSKMARGTVHYSTNFMRAIQSEAEAMHAELVGLTEQYEMTAVSMVEIAFTDMREDYE